MFLGNRCRRRVFFHALLSTREPFGIPWAIVINFTTFGVTGNVVGVQNLGRKFYLGVKQGNNTVFSYEFRKDGTLAAAAKKL